jgi:hypothetical protein
MPDISRITRTVPLHKAQTVVPLRFIVQRVQLENMAGINYFHFPTFSFHRARPSLRHQERISSAKKNIHLQINPEARAPTKTPSQYFVTACTLPQPSHTQNYSGIYAGTSNSETMQALLFHHFVSQRPLNRRLRVKVLD